MVEGREADIAAVLVIKEPTDTWETVRWAVVGGIEIPGGHLSS